MTNRIFLADRGVVEVSGPDAAKFLHNLLTNNIASLTSGEARYAALLSPQGKILVDFLVFAHDDEEGRRFLLDCPRAHIPDLLQRLTIYRLRSQVAFRDRSDDLRSVALFDSVDKPDIAALAIARDPRAPTLGWRAIVPLGEAEEPRGRETYEALRIAAGVPDGGVDFAYGDAFPHEANMDLLGGVDFAKGCFVGQEVVSRMKHRGTVRKRVTPFRVNGLAPAPGTPIKAGDVDLGVTGSRHGGEGLALIRLDRLEDVKAAGKKATAGGVELELTPQEV
jgi:folate-binding protein YgfZ